MITNKDPRVDWELGWKAIKAKIKAITKAIDVVESKQPRLEDQIYDLRMEISLRPEATLIQQLRDLEDEVRRHERRNDHLW